MKSRCIFWHFPITSLWDCDTCVFQHIPILTISNSDTVWLKFFQILTLSAPYSAFVRLKETCPDMSNTHKMRQCNRCSIRIFCVYGRCISVKWTLIPHLWHHIWLNFDGKNLKNSAKLALSVSYNLSKVEHASIPEFNSYSHGLNWVGIYSCNLGGFRYL